MNRLRSIRRFLLAALTTGLLLYAALTTAKLGRASWLGEQDSYAAVAGAAALAPDCARYQVRLGEALRLTDRLASRRAFERAVALNPLDADTWIRLGLDAEAEGNLDAAEGHLLRAAAVSRRYRPRWTLADYYFRRGQPDSFWRWAKEAAATAPGDLTSLYRLCWRLEPNPEQILRQVTPATAEGLQAFLLFLFTKDHAEGIELVSHRLALHRRPESVRLLLAACELLISRGRYEDGLRLWNAIAEPGLLPYEPVRRGQSTSITNANLRYRPLGQGFDWRVAVPEGATYRYGESSSSLTLWFSGSQADEALLLSQYAPVTPGTDYRLCFRYRTSREVQNATGLRWQVVDILNGAELGPESDISPSPRYNSITGRLTGRPTGGFVRLALLYRRASGVTKLRGSITLSEVQLEAVE